MDLDDFLGPVDLRAANRWEAIDELLDQLVLSNKVNAEDKATIAASVKKRETSMSTGIGSGIAIPHASTNRISEAVAVVGRSRKGIEFDSIDSKPVNLVVLFLVPEGRFQPHLYTLANIAKTLQTEEFRNWLRRRFL